MTRNILFFLLIVLAGCARNALLDVAMGSGYRPPPPAPLPGPYQLLAGDMHCHVTPPDAKSHVVRGVPETVDLAREEGLDFVVLTPHVRALFYLDPARRQAFLRDQAELKRAIAAEDAKDLVLIPGFEYTDYAYGHVGVAFADAEKLLADLPVDQAAANPELFFERWVGSGGLLVINHPILLPLPKLMFSAAQGNLSWRPFTAAGPYPPEIASITRLAQGVEVYNLSVSHVRDGLLLGDRDRTLRMAAFLADRHARAERRRVSLVGGSDSHGHHLRATTFVLAEARTESAIGEAIRAGRTCVRSPEACSLEARPLAIDPRAAWMWMPVGSSLHASVIEVRANGAPIEILKNGAVVAEPAAREVAQIAVEPGVCTTVRARVGEGLSSPIYVNCAFAD